MRGRPVKSIIRQNIVEILFFMKSGHGYEIYKVYRQLFPGITMRSVYYHLKKGLFTGEFKVERVSRVKGNYSWGGEAQLIYYSLSDKAEPKILKRVEHFFSKYEMPEAKRALHKI